MKSDKAKRKQFFLESKKIQMWQDYEGIYTHNHTWQLSSLLSVSATAAGAESWEMGLMKQWGLIISVFLAGSLVVLASTLAFTISGPDAINQSGLFNQSL